MNLILQKQEYPRSSINLENRSLYINLLERVQLNREYIKFRKFIYLCLQKRAVEINAVLEENKENIFKKLMKKSTSQ